MKNVLGVSVFLTLSTGSWAWAPAGIPGTSQKKKLTTIGSSNVLPRLYVAKDIDEDVSGDISSGNYFASGLSNKKDWKQPIPYSDLTIGVLKENYPGENRVSQTPDSVQGLVKAGFTVVVEAGGT